ncbi:MAG TPA: type IV toxin-antitoxin system AbiEi family antitoxin domain-containing protein [Acidimicrobiia bacterium]|nr:type IV toxin-antitoxin system AbiEi family antitoxin domain-containing protein [Acidimicrobiia bacterium]
MGISRRVLDLASHQGGYIRRDQLFSLGLSPSAVDRRVNEGAIILVTPGVYLVIPSNDHIDLIHGAVLALPDAIVSHQSATHLLHFPRLPELKPTVVVPSHTTHRFPGVVVRRCDDLIDSDVVDVEGIAVTGATRTFFDLGGVLRFREFDAIGESLVIAGRMDLDEFEQMTRRLARRGKPGSRAARDFLEIRAGSHRRATVLERKGRAVLSSAGLPDPRPEFPIPWAPRRRFDDAYPDAAMAIEWDSRAWHEQRAAMASDRRRDREAAAHGWVVLRFTWDEVTQRPNEIVESVATLLRDRRIAV